MSNQNEILEDLSIASLRSAAKALGITADRKWEKEDFVRAIKAKRQGDDVTKIVFDNSGAPAPGYARILVHRDPTPGHKNSPIHVGFNGQLYQIPRNIEVDVPKEFVESLANARTVQIRQEQDATRKNPGGVYKDEEQLSYPFQVLAITPGQWKNPHDSRAKSYAIRKQFNEEFGSWPTDGELKEYKKNHGKK